jgi:hypothetical protein
MPCLLDAAQIEQLRETPSAGFDTLFVKADDGPSRRCRQNG